PRGAREARTVAFRRVGDQRELTDDEHRAADLEHAPVELAVVVLEDPKPRHLPCQARRVGRPVAFGHAKEDAHPGADLAPGCDTGPSDALDDRSHCLAAITESVKRQRITATFRRLLARVAA